MKCERALDKIPEYIEGDLPEGEIIEMKAHLEVCANCRQELESYRDTWDALDAWEEVEPSADFTEKFRHKAFQPGILEVLAKMFTFRVPAWAVALMLLVAFLAGHFPGAVSKPANDNTAPQVVYVTETDAKLTQSMQVPGRMVTMLPTPTEVLKKMDNTGQVDVLPDWNEDYTLERVNPITILDKAESS